MCRLPTTKQAHHRKQISTTINDRAKRSGCRSEDFHQVGPQGWIPFITDQRRRWMEDSISYTIRTLRAQSNAIRTGQCPCNLSSNDEYNIKKLPRSRGSSLFGWHTYLLRKRGRTYCTSKKVLAQLGEYDLAVSTTKSVFHVKEVEFLGYMVAVDGVTMSERKVQSIKDWKHPRSIKEVQIFIGFANFYWRFIKDFSKICKPITETLKGDARKFSCGAEQNKAFEELKTRFITAPILCHFFPDRETIVETDASDFALDCVLSQFKNKRLHAVAFHSRKLSDAERNYEIHDKELLAILEAFTEWPHSLVGTKDPITV